ncbi:MAG: PA domain-containing protein, partial [Verrucomicrobiae bacterium]|nr:PA domain-containing protein [Verrucomicrobiae bacterium]
MPEARGVALFLGFMLALTAAAAERDAALRADSAALTQQPHRLVGTAEGRAAAAYVAKRLRAMGLDAVIEQEFPAAQMRVLRCEVEVRTAEGAARTLALLPMRANGIMPPVTPPGGLSGPLLHAGRGDPEDFGERRVAGAIVVLDYNCGRGWLRAFRQGALAVIFVPAERAEAWHCHASETTANLPRFYLPAGRSALPEGAIATIHSEIVWETAYGCNVFGYLRGSQPVFDLEKEEAIILATALDSYGEVPFASPGGRGAANIAVLLRL